MRVFKFGGASVKDANAVKNLGDILNRYPQDDLVVVVSAMGKTTNSLELLTNSYYQKKTDTKNILDEIKKYHLDIMDVLFPDKTHFIYQEINNTFVEIEWAIEEETAFSYDHIYDQIVCMGEIISTKIVAHYLNSIGIACNWMDARDIIKTDNTYREGLVDWSLSQALMREKLKKIVFPNRPSIVLTQGFIGGTSENYTTTLGREGSDYTAAIIAYCLEAKDVTIWKDVPGLLNADPKHFQETELIKEISYQDAIELAYYGASVIHPKTIKPLQNKNIPLYVKSFVNANESGTVIGNNSSALPIPCYIFKGNQLLVSISPKDFSFIVEENLSEIFKLFSEQKIRINTMHNSAISFSACVDFDEKKINLVIERLKEKYRVLYNEGLELVTIRYYNQSTIDKLCVNKNVLLEVRSRYTAQLVVKEI